MRRYFLLVPLLLAACATNYVPPSRGGSTVDYVQQQSGQFGWSGVYVGATLQEVEKNTGQVLSPYAGGYPVCGNLSADLVLQGRKVVLQLDKQQAITVVQSVAVTLPESERNTPMPEMADSLKRHFPKLTVTFSGPESVELVTPDHQAILIKNNKEHFLDVSRTGCIE